MSEDNQEMTTSQMSFK